MNEENATGTHEQSTWGVGPYSGDPSKDPNFSKFDPELLANGDTRNVIDKYRYWSMEAIVAEREANGRFTSLEDLFRRVPQGTMNRRQLEGLAAAGAFDSLEPNRAKVLANADMLLAVADEAARSRSSGQGGLFGGDDDEATPEEAATVATAIRSAISNSHGGAVAEATRILYGGSVKANNVAGFLRRDQVDGVLVGGASLDAEEFAGIARFKKHLSL